MNEDQAKTGQETEEETFSLDDIDSLIANEDPDFLNEMSDIQSVGNDVDTNIVSLDPDAEAEEEAPLRMDQPVSRKEKIYYRIMGLRSRVLNFYNSILLKIKNYSKLAKDRSLVLFSNTKAYLRHELPERIRFYVGQAKTIFIKWKTWFLEQLGRYKNLSKIEKVGFWAICMAGLSALLTLQFLLVGGYLPRFHNPLVRSLNVNGKSLGVIQDRSQIQDLFHAFPDVEFHVLLKKVIVNLKPDDQSTKTPMGLYEVYLGLDSKDTAIEVKDREREILDIIQRGLESFSYSETGSQVGKMRMKTIIKDRVNEALNQGQVFHVYFNNFVTKQ